MYCTTIMIVALFPGTSYSHKMTVNLIGFRDTSARNIHAKNKNQYVICGSMTSLFCLKHGEQMSEKLSNGSLKDQRSQQAGVTITGCRSPP